MKYFKLLIVRAELCSGILQKILKIYEILTRNTFFYLVMDKLVYRVFCHVTRFAKKILSAILMYHFAVEVLLYVLEVTSSEGVKLIFC